MNKSTFNEDAKQDWLNVVKKHKKKQKGLPALSRLNTNAGNVEKNIELFNKMASHIDSPNNNPISGPFGGDVSFSTEVAGGLAENYLEESTMNTELIELHYPELKLYDVTTGELIRGDYYTPDEYKTTDVTIDYTYTITRDRAIEALSDLEEVQKLYWPEGDTYGEAFDAYLDSHFDELFDKYEEQLLEYFKEQATKEAEEDFDYEEYFGESLKSNKLKTTLDDDFNMSLRTLL